MIIHNVLQHYYDERCRPESWSSWLTPPLADNNRGASAFIQSLQKNTANICFETHPVFVSCTKTKTQS